MKRLSFPLAVAAIAAVLMLGCASGPEKPRKNVVVQINDMSVAPKVALVTAGENSVAWTNWSRLNASVNFPLSIKEAFTCDELRPDFAVSGNRVESIRTAGSNEDLVTPCPLKPGRYEYEVWLFNSIANEENPQLKVKGVIQVVD